MPKKGRAGIFFRGYSPFLNLMAVFFLFFRTLAVCESWLAGHNEIPFAPPIFHSHGVRWMYFAKSYDLFPPALDVFCIRVSSTLIPEIKNFKGMPMSRKSFTAFSSSVSWTGTMKRKFKGSFNTFIYYLIRIQKNYSFIIDTLNVLINF